MSRKSLSACVTRPLLAFTMIAGVVVGSASTVAAAPGLGSNISIEFSGTAPFADFGTGGTLEPGDDFSGDQEAGFDGIRHYVRTGDRSSVKLEYSVNSEDATHLALEATVVEVDALGNVIGPAPAGITIPEIPPVCQGGSSLSADGQTMTCFIGAIPSGTTAFVTAQVQADNTVENGTRFQVQYKAVEQDDAVETPDVFTDTLVVSSAPRFDLWKKQARSYTPFTAPAGHPQAGTVGGVYVFNLGVLGGDGDARGLSMLAEYDANKNGAVDPGEDLNGNGTIDNVVTFTDDLSAFPAGTVLLDFHPTFDDGCGTNGGAQPLTNTWFFSSAPGGGLHPSYADDRETRDSGIWECAQVGNEVTVTITNADWSGASYPTKTINGTTMSADQKWMASGYMMVWVPADAIRDGVDGIPGNADDGQFPITNTAGGFDPDDIWGLNNYGAGTEPLIDDANLGHRRNALDYTLVEGGIGWDKFYRKDSYPNASWSDPVTNATSHFTGDGQAMSGTTFGTYQAFTNNSFEKRTGVQLCDAFDNATYTLSPDAANRLTGTYFTGTSVDPGLPTALTGADVLIEFGTGLNGGIAGSWADGNHAVPSDPATWAPDDHWQRPGWDLQQQATCGDADSADGWFTLDSPFDPADLPAGVTLDDITKMRTRIVHPDVAPTGDWKDQSVLPPGVVLRTTSRHEALPGLIDVTPGDGDATNAFPTILANMATREFKRLDGTTNTFNNQFDPADYSQRTGSDRLTLTKAQVRLDKEFIEKIPGSGPNFLGGDDVTWTLQPTVAQIGDIVAPPATDVRVVDEFPADLDYVAGSADPASFTDLVSSTVYPVEFCIVAGCDKDDPSNWTTTEPGDPLLVLGLMWDLGEVPLGTALPIFSYTTNIPLDTPHNTDFLNTATIHSPDDNADEARRSDDTSVKALQTGAFAVRKKVNTPLIFTDEIIEWELEFANVSAVDTTYDIIDILPWNGDGGGALPDPKAIPSDFTGGLELLSVVPDAGNVASISYYTTAAPGTINENPSDATNDLAAGLWCSDDDASVPDLGTAGCPAADLSDATAFRLIGEALLGSLSGTPSGGQVVTVQAQTVGNDPIDFYANEFVAKVPDAVIVLPVKSNEVYTRVWGGSIGDLIFEDIDRDGTFNAGDNPIPGVAVELVDAGGVVVDTTTTDGAGRYIFDLITRPGDFRVRLAQSNFDPGGVMFAMIPTINAAADPDVDLNENVDHDAVTALAGGNYETGVMSLGVGTEPVTEDVAGTDVSGAVDTDSNMSIDLGFILPVPGISIEKKVEDPDNAGTFVESIQVQPGDTATFQIVVTNTGEVDLDNVAVSDPLAASCDNTIGSLAALAVVTYTCTLVVTDSLTPNTASVSGDPVDGQTTVTDDDTASVTLLGKIGDTIWFDTDGNGVQDAGEPGIEGVDVVVTWFGPDGVPGGGDDVAYPATTDANGEYLVEDLVAGTYTVTVDPLTLPDGLTQTFDADGIGTGNTSQLNLGDGETNLDQDFGYTGTGSIGDTIYLDQDLSGTHDPGEDGIGGVGVTVTWLGPDGVAGGGDDVVYTATTDADGKYLVENLPAGEYTVVVDTADLPGDYTNVADPDGANDSQSALTLGDGENNLDQDFGYAGNGSIGDTIYLDQNGDGDQDAGEPGLVGVIVELVHFGPDGVLGGDDDSSFTTTTGADGKYLFENLPQGNYEVTVTGGITLVDNTDDPDTAGPGDSTSLTTLTAAAPDDLDQDFGYHADSVLGDRVWWDRNGDGVQDPDEPGIAGVDLIVTYYGPDGVAGGGDDLDFPATTDANGNYLVENIPNGNYGVNVAGGVPPGFTQTYDASGPQNDGSSTTTLVDADLDQDFGYNGDSSIGDTIWLDTNGDGVIDPGESGLEGVEVILTWFGPDGVAGGIDDIILTTTTDANGNYLFDNLPAGEFIVDVNASTLPTGVAATYDKDGGTGTPDGQTPVTLGASEDITDVDFGYGGSGSIGDTIWFDRDGDGIFDPDEYPLSGVDVTLVWDSPSGPVTFTATTDANGEYLFPGLAPGDYTVTVDEATLPPGMVATFDADEGTNGLNSTSALTLGDGEDNLDQDFGYKGTGSIGDTIYLDLDGDGVQGPDEPGVANQTVELTWQSPDGPVTFTTTTDADGNYLFGDLPAGDYTVTVIDGIVNSATNTGDPGGDGDSTNSLTLGIGEANEDQDFGYQGNNAIGDQIWYDQNADGVFDATEAGLEGVEVTVVWFGPDGVAGGGDDVTLPTTTSDVNGVYLVPNLPDGSYSVTVTNGLPTGLDTNTYDGDDMAVNPNGTSIVTDLGVGTDDPVADLDQDFGYTGTGSIGDTIYWDVDGDGAQGPDEPGIAGVDVTVTWLGPDGVAGGGDDVVFTATTDADGKYLVENLPAGEFTVAVDEADLPPGMTQTGDPDGGNDGQSSVSLADGEENLEQDFGYKGDSSIGDFVWYDVDGDGVQDPDEPGVAGVPVTVTYYGADGAPGGGDDVVFTTTTDANGNYLVEGLVAGSYGVAIDTAGLPPGLSADSDLDGGDPAATAVTLGASEDKRDVDFGIVGDATLGHIVWNDSNGDGVQDPGEAGVPGVTVQVTWQGPNGPVTQDVVTGPDGTWELTNLPPGDYTVTLDESTLPDGKVVTTPPTGDVTLEPGDSKEVNFGIATGGSIGSTVWMDLDGDGIVVPTEAGIAGVTVELYDSDGNLVATLVTDGDGGYNFTDLPPGDYVVKIVASTLPDKVRAVFEQDGSTDLSTPVSLAEGATVEGINFGFQPVVTILPKTGLTPGRVISIAGLLLLAGLALIGAGRRRERLRVL